MFVKLETKSGDTLWVRVRHQPYFTRKEVKELSDQNYERRLKRGLYKLGVEL